ncbi:MAG: alpha/beta hydrolase, partial [Verrucomicrobiota bacterium]
MKRTTVNFESHGTPLAGHFYLPENHRDGKKIPGVLITGAWTTVKEQMAGEYAAALAKRGFAVLTFDFRGWGESPDKVRYLEDPKRKTEDILAGLNVLARRSEIDADRIGGLGICASAGFMSDAALRSPALKALALVAPWLHDREIVEAVYGGKEGVASLIDLGRKAAAAEKPIYQEAA